MSNYEHAGALPKEAQEAIEKGDALSLNDCPKCGGPADNGHDRELPPNPYFCTKCADSLNQKTIGEKIASKYDILEPFEMACLAEEIDKAMGDYTARKNETHKAKHISSDETHKPDTLNQERASKAFFEWREQLCESNPDMPHSYDDWERASFEAGYNAASNEPREISGNAKQVADYIWHKIQPGESGISRDMIAREIEPYLTREMGEVKVNEALGMLQDLIDGGEECRGMDSAISDVIRVLQK